MNINKLDLHFDDKAMYEALINQLIEAVWDTAEDAKHNMMASASEKLKDEANFFTEDINEVRNRTLRNGFDFIVVAVGVSHWYAFIDNYGTGSLMANSSQNPFLEEYLNSEYFNKLRTTSDNYTVRARDEGEYVVPNWDGGKGTVNRATKGNNAGQSLEVPNPRTGKQYFTPQAPQFWLEQSLQSAKWNLEHRIKGVLNTFPYHRYLRGGGA